MISKIKIERFRNLTAVELNPISHFNVFYGKNGSGKTNILEALYYISRGRSFRTHLNHRIIQQGHQDFSIFCCITQNDTEIPVGIRRLYDGDRQIRFNHQTLLSITPLAEALPIIYMSTNSYRYFHDGPKTRRSFLDWGVFHVKHQFYPQWQILQQALKHRNAALKQQRPYQEFEPWNREFVSAAEYIDQWRKEYIEELQLILNELLQVILQGYDLQLRYYRGWNKEKNLAHLLTTHFITDQQLGYTQYGPHRADLQLYIDNVPAQDVLSQGQQKLAVYALFLAQGIQLKQQTQTSPIFLIDDLPSELDQEKRTLITGILEKLDSQVFINGITQQDLSEILALKNTQLFHVKHGTIKAIAPATI